LNGVSIGTPWLALNSAWQSERMKLLFIGDIAGSPGRQIVVERLADIVESRQIDLVIANGENSAAGFGITPRIAEQLFAAGVEVITGGNHIWDKKEILEYISHEPRLIRPANFPEGNPGSGLFVGTAHNGVPYAVIDLQGRVFMASNDCPFRAADRELARIPADVRVIFVDVHAETTSEKIAMGWYLDGRVSAVVGTHTHVATADGHVLPGGTAFQTDVGMTGPHNGIIGMDKTAILRKFLDGQPARFEVATGDVQMNTVLVDVDETTGRARGIERLRFHID
jgi:metallophosphoesterase (TIGR00282 family)